VVGGGDKGGIVVRTDKDVSSSQAPGRLSTGALVSELALEGERLHYQRLTGSGPESGWVSIKLKDTDKALVVRCSKAAAAEASSEAVASHSQEAPAAASALLSAMPDRPSGPVAGRKMRVVGVHGTPANSSIMKFQCTLLRKALGTNVEWIFIDAPTPWAPNPGSGFPNDDERSEFERRLAQGKPFVQWYYTHVHGAGGYHDDEWHYVEECVRFLWEFFAREAPVDLVVAFSQGSSMVAILIEMMRRAGQEPPWRGNVLFNGGNVDDKRYEFQEQCDLPTVYVAGGAADTFGEYITGEIKAMYSNLTLLEHQDGHNFPTTQPRASEVMDQVAGLMRKMCGLPEAKPEPAPAAPKKAPAPPAAKPAPAPAKVASGKVGRRELDGDDEPDFPPGMWTVDYIGQARGKCKGCKCEWYQWNPNKLRPERGDSGDATITEWFLNDYDSLNCQACKCKFNQHTSLGPVNKPAGFYPGINEADVNAMMGGGD